MFSPFTIEANYNQDIPDYEIPYTVCHELAHLKGWIREDEAGFIAYLACRESQEPALQYSGTLNALSYAMSAFVQRGPLGKLCADLRFSAGAGENRLPGLQPLLGAV